MPEASLRLELFVHDLDAQFDFYVRVLFRGRPGRPPGGGAVSRLRRGAVHIGVVGAWAPTELELRLPPQGVEIVLEVDDVDAEHSAIIAAGRQVFEDIVERPWGQRDFRLLDPAGHFLRVTDRGCVLSPTAHAGATAPGDEPPSSRRGRR